MRDTSRDAVEQEERARGALRALYLGELAQIRRERTDALRRAEEQLDRLARLLPMALDAGIGLSEVARAVDVSRPTLYQLRARYSEDVADVRLAVLQETIGGANVESIVTAVRRPRPEVETVLGELASRNWIEETPPELQDFENDPVDWWMTADGLDALRSWTLELYGPDGAP